MRVDDTAGADAQLGVAAVNRKKRAVIAVNVLRVSAVVGRRTDLYFMAQHRLPRSAGGLQMHDVVRIFNCGAVAVMRLVVKIQQHGWIESEIYS